MIDKIQVHDGIFHCDDLFSVALCDQLFQKVSQDDIIRSRETTKARYVFDVGGGEFDHHQRDFSKFYPNGVKYAACGLVLDKFCSDDELKEFLLINGLYGIQVQDNGQQELTKEFNNPFACLSLFNANDEDIYSEIQDLNFYRAFQLASEFVEKLIKKFYLKKSNVEYVKKCIQPNQQFVYFDKYASGWQEVICNTNESLDKKILLIVFKSSDSKFYLQVVPKELNSFESHVKLPEEWGGLKDEELKRISGYKSITFCHKALFLAVFEDKDEAISAASSIIRRIY